MGVRRLSDDCLTQGLRLWFFFFLIWLTDRNMYVNLIWRGFRNCEMWTFLTLQPVFEPMIQLANTQFFFGKKSLNVLNVKLFSKFFFQHFGAPFDGFLFQTLIKGKYFSICWPVTCYCLKMATKLAIIQNLLRNKRCFTNWTIYDLQHQFN